MAGIFASPQIHDVQAPHEIESAPPARAYSLDLAGIAPDIDMRAIFQCDLPNGHFATEIERDIVGVERSHAAYLVATLDLCGHNQPGIIGGQRGQGRPDFAYRPGVCCHPCR